MPSGLQGTIVKVFKLTARKYNLLFTAYTWPDVFLSLVGAILIDRVIGLRTGFFVVTVTAILGKAIFTLGAFMDSFYVLVVGRFIMGCGIGSLMSCLNVFLYLWFKNKEVVFAMSVVLCTCRLGASLGLVLPQMLYENISLNQLSSANQFKLGLTFLVGFIFLLSSIIVSIAIILLDIRGAAKLNREPFKRRQFDSKDLKDFSLKFWLVIIAFAMFYGVLFVFVANGQLFFMSKFGFDTKHANIADFLVFAAPILVNPVIGFLVDKIGFNVIWGLTGTILCMLSHFLFNIVNAEQMILPFLIAVLFSIGYSFYGTSIYVMPSFIVQEHQITTAYGIYNTLYCLMFTCISFGCGTIVDYAGYMWAEIYFFLLTYAIFMLLIVVATMDRFTSQKKVNKAGSWLKENIKYWKLKRAQKNAKEVFDYLSDGFEYVNYQW